MLQTLPIVLWLGRGLVGESGYIDPRACATCHAAIYSAYRETGMARSFSKAVSPPEGSYYHAASNRHYRVLKNGSEAFLRRYQVDAAGAEVNVVEKRIDYAIGSGNHARSFAHRTADGGSVELPLTWYAEKDGFWAMSPGYDCADHLDFRRKISDSCLFCHNGYPTAWNLGLAEGIDCQRCHGPGEAHARRPSKANILNPGHLDAARQMDVCLQCHLETTSRGIPDSIRRDGRGVFSYRPGESLSSYKLYFDHAAGSGRNDKFEINHAGYRLQQSKCYQAARDRMTCITCHDPHHPAAGEGSSARYRSACQGCHHDPHASQIADCVSCHMAKRRTDDAVHVVMTDHRIVRRPPPRDLLAPLSEDHRPYLGEVVFYGAPLRDPDAALYLAAAQVREGNNLERGIAMLESALRRLRPSGALFYLNLAEAYRKTGNPQQALVWCRAAVKREPTSPEASQAFGDALLRAGRAEEAVAVLEHTRHMRLSAPLLATLGVAYGAAGHIEDSLAALRNAVRVDPDLPIAWLNLGVTLEQASRFAEAETAYREAVRIQPDFARAWHHWNALVTRVAK